MKINKTKTLCIGSLFLSYYLISKLLPFNIAMFTKGGLILGLVFPFIEKKLRVIITVIYQGITSYKLFILLRVSFPTISAFFSYVVESTAPTITPAISNGVISNKESVVILLYALYPQIIGVMKFFTGVLAMTMVLMIFYNFVSLLASFTEPYSCFYLYSKLGLFRLIEKTTGGRIVIDDR